MKNIWIFHLKTFIFLVVKFSVYLNRLSARKRSLCNLRTTQAQITLLYKGSFCALRNNYLSGILQLTNLCSFDQSVWNRRDVWFLLLPFFFFFAFVLFCFYHFFFSKIPVFNKNSGRPCSDAALCAILSGSALFDDATFNGILSLASTAYTNL